MKPLQNDKTVLHIGEIVKKVKEEKRMTIEEIAEGMNLSKQAVSDSFNQADMNTAKIRKFCEVLHYDFFKHLADKPTEPTTKKYSSKKTDIQSFQETLQLYSDKSESHVSVTFKVPAEKTTDLFKLLFS